MKNNTQIKAIHAEDAKPLTLFRKDDGGLLIWTMYYGEHHLVAEVRRCFEGLHAVERSQLLAEDIVDTFNAHAALQEENLKFRQALLQIKIVGPMAHPKDPDANYHNLKEAARIAAAALNGTPPTA